MDYKEIPEGSVEIQKGLWWHIYKKTILGKVRNFGDLYSSNGYCFYEISQPENYDENENLKPENERIYAVYCSLAVDIDEEEINANIVSVPYKEGYTVV